jgi:hypothetical protein
MTEVGRIKAAPEERHALVECRMLHLPMLTPERPVSIEPRLTSNVPEIALLASKERRCVL